MFKTSELLDLVSGKLLYLQVPRFISNDACRYVSKRILENEAVQPTSLTTGLTYEQLLKIANVPIPEDDIQYARGMSYYETKHESGTGWGKVKNEASHQAYYGLAPKSKSLTRQIFSPYGSPMDQFREELDKQWRAGSTTLDLGDGEMFFGLLRVLSNEVLAHEDKLERDHGPLPEHLGYVTQLASNIYLQVPETGGDLRLWDRSLPDAEYDAMRGATYGIEHDVLGEPDASVHPGMGDLIVFNARKLHGVGKSVGSKRISLSSFIMYCGEDRPLSFWS